MLIISSQGLFKISEINNKQLKLNNKHWPVIKPFLIYLKYIKNDQYTGITMDQDVINKLRKI